MLDEKIKGKVVILSFYIFVRRMENENINYGVFIFFSKRKSIFILFSIRKKILFEKINILFYFQVKIILYFIFVFWFSGDKRTWA